MARENGDGSGDDCRLEEFERATGPKVFGDPVAEEFGGGAAVEGLGLVELDHGFAVGRDDLGVDAVVFGQILGWGLGGRDNMDADGKLASASELVKGVAFGFDAEAGGGVVEEGDGVADEAVATFVGYICREKTLGAGFKGERALSWGGTELVGREALMDPLGAL